MGMGERREKKWIRKGHGRAREAAGGDGSSAKGTHCTLSASSLLPFSPCISTGLRSPILS